jgi:diguanylate cyclase (GGDEF)-like protein
MREEISNTLSLLLDCANRLNIDQTITPSQQDDILSIKNFGERLFEYFDEMERESLSLKQRLKQLYQANPNTDLQNEDKTYTLLALMFARLKQSINLEELLETFVLEIFQLLQIDQIIVHQLESPSSSQSDSNVQYEFVADPDQSLLGKPLPSVYIAPEWLNSYQKCTSQVINDINTFEGDRTVIESLKAKGIYSAIITAIPNGNKSWGLLIAHQYNQVRPWEEWEIEFLEKAATQLAISIHQMQLLSKSEAIRKERDQVIATLHYNQLHDSLTGLPNRDAFMELLDLAFTKSQTDTNSKFAVLFIECDRDKLANESFGISIDDQLLISISSRLNKYRNIQRSLAKIDGDKFVMLVEDVEDLESSSYLADQILDDLSQPFTIEDDSFFLAVNIGIAVSDAEYIYANEVLRDANIAMHHAKKIGKSTKTLFNIDIKQGAKLRWQMENDLRKALERQEFYLVYQPIISIHQHQLTGFEVLLRWEHPLQGLISPQEFLPVAEEIGEIVPIGYWVLETACDQLLTWQQNFPDFTSLTLSVNVSTLQVVQPDFVERVQSIVLERQISPRLIKLEITETVLMENIEVSSQKLEQLREIGMQVYIDDFGAGCSSFSYLQNLPIDVLKIDRSFTNRIFSDAKSKRIIQSILRLANNLGMGIVVEGIETAQELGYFEDIGGSHIELQGFFISHPLDSERATQWIHSSMTA